MKSALLPLCIAIVGYVQAAELSPKRAAKEWHQPAGPNGNWRVDGNPPVKWSTVRNENIRWRTPMPEAGMSGVAVWGDRVFTTTHVPIKKIEDKHAVTDVIGICLDANTGKILWQATLPGTAFISLAGGFTDGTVFAPITDGKHVWFFNRCGSIGCFDFEGKKIWQREWRPRFKHNNRQAEPFLLGDALLYVEVANKEAGASLQKWKAPGVKNKAMGIPAGIPATDVWTYIHGLDKHSGRTLWRERVGTSIHTTPVIGLLPNGKPAIAHARGGGHGPLEKPYGHSLTSLAPGEEGKTLWSTTMVRYDPPFSCHWNERYAFGFHGGKHIVFDIADGKILRQQQLYEEADLWKRNAAGSDWELERGVAVKAGKGHPNTNQGNIVANGWHWFLSHNVHYLGRVHIKSGRVEYLELPSRLNASTKDRAHDELLWGKLRSKNRPLNANGLAVGDKGHDGTGWGHISAASPVQVGRYLFFPVVTGTVYVIDSEAKSLTPKAIVSINDLGVGGETWTLASLSFARGRLYAHTMREIICIGAR